MTILGIPSLSFFIGEFASVSPSVRDIDPQKTTKMSSRVPISESNLTAPTPVNTPLNNAPISSGLSRPTVPDISEDNEPQDDDEEGSPDLNAMQSTMLGMVHGKLAGLVGKSSGYIESLPVEVKRNVEALKGVQVKQIDLQNKYKRECLELEKKVRKHAVFIIIGGISDQRHRPAVSRAAKATI